MLLAVLIAGCGGPAIAPSPCPASVCAAEPPPGDPRRNVDMAYARQVIAEPVLLEQIYYDASHGNQRAAWLVCELEATCRPGRSRFELSPHSMLGT